ncbi:VWA domain-containing protein [Methylosinus sp. H3A]|uniref:VWA domain-containing protein n=1 Tax=Methylosinus sp. H3A TaxID=2785786 RepID=UPI0018C23089|nr:vWA domain-containing protein [Methylosinus sp. H3A]MBG0810101.1 VWA domain-containing protein [Methylosinus sp. H3A]
MLVAAFVFPRASAVRNGVDALLTLDITGSMNTRDYALGGAPASRIDFAKQALRRLVADLPCPSRVGLAIFTEREPFLLFEPVDVCENFAAIDAAISGLDWRMAWEGDSRISAGLFRAIEMARRVDADLVFVTDGQEAPPPPAYGAPVFEGKSGEVLGLILGAGGYEPAPIPKFDDRGREIGFYGADEVPHESRFGLPPAGVEQREGYNPRNAPFGGAMTIGSEHLSSVREPYLRQLAERTGLAYAHLEKPDGLAAALLSVARPRPSLAPVDLRPAFAAAALAGFAALYLIVPLAEIFARRRRSRLATARPRRFQ